MAIDLIITPGKGKDWDSFVAEDPPFSIGIDGYVNAPPNFSAKGPHLNLDHHKGVDRLATYSTCKQMLLCIKMGLFQTFQKDGIPHAALRGDNCDQDVCATHFVADKHERFIGSKNEPRLMQFIDTVDLLDTTGGLYPMDVNSRIKREINWIFHPYTEVRTDGRLEKMSGEQMKQLVLVVGDRIAAFANGRGEQMESDIRHEIMHVGKGWVLFREIGADARHKVCSDYDGGYVMLREGDGSNHYHYSIGKKSKFYPFPVQKIMKTLNDAEGPDVPTMVMDKNAPRPTWGGSDIIGGSPKGFGSCLDPKQVIKIVEEVLVQTA